MNIDKRHNMLYRIEQKINTPSSSDKLIVVIQTFRNYEGVNL